MNKGFEQSTGEFLTWTSDDNYYLENAFEIMLYCLRKSKASLIYCNYFEVGMGAFGKDNKDNIEVKRFPDKHQIKIVCVVGPCFLYKKEVLDEISGYDCELSLGADYDYWLKIYKKFQIMHLDESLYYYRVHDKSLTGSGVKEYGIYIETILIWLRHESISCSIAFDKLLFYITKIVKIKRVNERKLEKGIATDRDFMVAYIMNHKILFSDNMSEYIRSLLNDFYIKKIGFKDAELAYNCALLLTPGYLPATLGIESVKISRSLNA